MFDNKPLLDVPRRQSLKYNKDTVRGFNGLKSVYELPENPSVKM